MQMVGKWRGIPGHWLPNIIIFSLIDILQYVFSKKNIFNIVFFLREMGISPDHET